MKQPDTALSAAVRYLSVAERTEAELRSHLEIKGFAIAQIDETVVWAKSKTYLSDARVADRELEIAKSSRPVGRSKVEAKLAKRLGDPDAAEQAVAQYSEAEETELATNLAKSKFTSSEKPEKVARFLVGKGFGEEAVRSALGSLFPELEW